MQPEQGTSITTAQGVGRNLIAKGFSAKPGNIPIELAMKFQTAVNLKTAKALGNDIPPTLLGAADEVTE